MTDTHARQGYKPQDDLYHDDRNEAGTRAGGVWLAAGAALLVAALLMHPPPPAELSEFMEVIAAKGNTWVLAHWMAAIALSFLAMAGLLILSTAGRLATGPLVMSGWALLVVGCLWTTATAVAEATVMATAAAAGDVATFEAWHSFAEGKAFGFAAVGLGIAAIAAGQIRAARSRTFRVASRIAVPLGVAAFVGFVLNGAAGIAAGGPVWLVSSILLGLWLVALGVSLVRVPAARATRGVVHA